MSLLRYPVTAFGETAFVKDKKLRFLLALTALAQLGLANAQSPACSKLNENSGTTSYAARFEASEFAPGESLVLSFADTGDNLGAHAVVAEVVLLRSWNLTTSIYDYRSNIGSKGGHSAVVSSSQLAAHGLYVRIKSGIYIGPVRISCSVQG